MKNKLYKNPINKDDLFKRREIIISKTNNAIKKRNAVLFQLKNLNVSLIIDKFTFINMKIEFQEYCSLFSKNTLCHKMTQDTLNCFGCVCPYYIMDIKYNEPEHIYQLGSCMINSKFGHFKHTQTKDTDPKDFLIFNCINCLVPHRKIFCQKLVKKELLHILSM